MSKTSESTSKRSITIAIVILVGIVIGFLAVRKPADVNDADSSSETQTQEMVRTFTNEEIGLSFEYPAEWGEVTLVSAPRYEVAGDLLGSRITDVETLTFLEFKDNPEVTALFTDRGAHYSSDGVNLLNFSIGGQYTASSDRLCTLTSKHDSGCDYIDNASSSESSVKLKLINQKPAYTKTTNRDDLGDDNAIVRNAYDMIYGRTTVDFSTVTQGVYGFKSDASPNSTLLIVVHGNNPTQTEAELFAIFESIIVTREDPEVRVITPEELEMLMR